MPTDLEFWRYIVSQGGFALLAVLMFVAYRKDVKTTAEVLVKVVRENTASYTELTVLLRALHARLDREERHRDATV